LGQFCSVELFSQAFAGRIAHVACFPGRKSSPYLLPGSGQIDRLGSRCAARAGGGYSAQCAHERSRVLLQGLAIDVRHRVARTVIAGIVWATSLAAEQLGLALRLLSGCAGIEAYSRDALLGERRVVGSKSTTAALIERQVVRSEIGDDLVSHDRSQ